MIVGLIVAAALALGLVCGYGLGIRSERARAAFWKEINTPIGGRATGGLRLKRLRITR